MASIRRTARNWDRNATYDDTSVTSLAQRGGSVSWLDISHGGSSTVLDDQFASSRSLFSLQEDCAYVLAADFPVAQDLFRPECTSGCSFAGTNSADVLNLLSGLAEIAPRVMPVSAAQPWMFLMEDGIQTISRGNGVDNSTVTLQPKRPPPAPRSGGGRRGRKRQPRSRASGVQAPMTFLFRGTIGDSGSLQALSLPWTLSLQKLNRALAPLDGST